MEKRIGANVQFDASTHIVFKKEDMPTGPVTMSGAVTKCPLCYEVKTEEHVCTLKTRK